MKIKIRNKSTFLNTALNKPTDIFINIDRNETLVINHNGSHRKIKVAVDYFDELVILRRINLLKSEKEIKKELKEK